QLVDRLLTRSGTTEELVELYRTALEHRFDPDEQVSLLHQIADLSKNDLKDPDSAIDAHQRVLDLDDQNVRSLDALTLLYASEKRYVDLAELYLRRAESVEPGEAVKYRLALAALYKNRLDQPEAALDQLEEITRDFPQHVDAISRIEAFRSSEELRPRAVEILRPLYEDADDWRKLIALGEDRFDLSEDAHERVQILRESAELWELRGEDAERAFQVLVQALRIVPDDEQTRLDIERLVVSTAEWRL